MSWRRGGDSNSRASFRRPNDLANRPLQPLGYLSTSALLRFRFCLGQQTKAIACALLPLQILKQSNRQSRLLGLRICLLQSNRCSVDCEAHPKKTLLKTWVTISSMEQQTAQPNQPQDAHQNAPVAGTQQVAFNQQSNSAAYIQPDNAVTWEASEYIHHKKSGLWYIALLLAAVILGAILFLVLHDILSIIVLALAVIALGAYAQRKPDVLRYTISDQGLAINERSFSFTEFRSFAVVQDGGIYSIVLDPLRRFMPQISIYFSPDDGQQILDILGRNLPQVEKELDLIDRVTRSLRF